MQGQEFIDTPIEFLKGVGPKRADALRKELEVSTFGDLLTYFPFRYLDRSKIHHITEISDDLTYVQLKGKIVSLQIAGRPGSERMTALFRDDTGQIELVWFKGIRWLKESVRPNTEYILLGRPSYFNGRYNIAHPELEFPAPEGQLSQESFQPMYNSTEKLKSLGLESRGIRKIMRNLVDSMKGRIPETLTRGLIDELRLPGREEALLEIHFPGSRESLQRAQARLKFEELFYIQLRLLKMKIYRQRHQTGYIFGQVGELLNTFYRDYLPFPLTGAQKRVIREIRADLGSGHQMNRLLQGDVGSGKTLVALMIMLIALDNGFQACFMAPTEILARQHYQTLSKFLENLPVSIELLTGSTRPAARKKILEKLQSGELRIIAGTHALIEESVQFQNLGLAVIDEQHRFGVMQRAKIWGKAELSPHILVMTATPIPRTLALTLYGDLDISVIDEMPPGRKAVKTLHFTDSHRLRVFGFMRNQIREGRQVYVVYPLINESESLDLKFLMDGYESICRDFPLPEFAVSIVHGKMKAADRDYEMKRFVKGETQIMVSTTVIEVGVDVPNASVMVIENAERFGLSQLHQLRGRVGRGVDQSYCLLMTGDKISADARQRVETMVRTTDGFEIAEADLRLRGPGDLQGTRQSGIIELKIADVIRDEKILKYARSSALKILQSDPLLNAPGNFILKNHLQKIELSLPDLGRIS